MKKIVGFWVVGALGALFVGGCASENVVKKDEAVAPSATTQAKQASDKKMENTSAATTTVEKAPESGKTDMSHHGTQSMEQMKSALDKIYFDFDSFALSEKSRSILTTNADYLKKHAEASFRIEGNCDERGSAEYNIALGEKRAKAAMQYLTTMGVSEKRLTTISYGKENPADPGHDDEALSKNRRDDFSVISK